MRKIFCHMLASAVAFTSCILPSATTVAIKCPDVEFIFARGSGQELGGREYQAFESSLKTELADSELTYRFYELGTTTHGGYKYPAIEANLFTSLGAVINSNVSKLSASADQGAAELIVYITEVSHNCPDTKFVLGGYSQGSMAIMNSLNFIDSEKIIYVANFGDPKLYLPEGKGTVPDACLGKNLSDYRVFVPNCKTNAGILKARKPYRTIDYVGKIGLWCNNQDLFCGAGFKISNPAEPHAVYATDGHIATAATIIREKLEQAFPEAKFTTFNAGTPFSPLKDTVFLLDTTSSMNSSIKKAKQNILSLANKTLANPGGRIALYTYRDLIEDYYATRHLDFGATYADLEATLKKISVSGGDDKDESTLSAIMTVLNNQSWRFGATKSIVIVTDAGFHNPDRDGTTLWQVILRSLEIDPVNIYVYTNDEIKPLYTELIEKTAGNVFNLTDVDSVNIIGERPSVTLPLPEYHGVVGDEFTFAAAVSDGIAKYEWDLDFDGVFEKTSTSPTINHIYNNADSGFIQLRVTDQFGRFSTASARVSISKDPAPTPEFKNLKYTFDDNSLKVSYLKDNLYGAIITIDDVVIGYTEEDEFTINGLSNNSVATLTPISNSGELGDAISIEQPGAPTETPDSAAISKDGPAPIRLRAPNAGAH